MPAVVSRRVLPAKLRSLRSSPASLPREQRRDKSRQARTRDSEGLGELQLRTLAECSSESRLVSERALALGEFKRERAVRVVRGGDWMRGVLARPLARPQARIPARVLLNAGRFLRGRSHDGRVPPRRVPRDQPRSAPIGDRIGLPRGVIRYSIATGRGCPEGAGGMPVAHGRHVGEWVQGGITATATASPIPGPTEPPHPWPPPSDGRPPRAAGLRSARPSKRFSGRPAARLHALHKLAPSG